MLADDRLSGTDVTASVVSRKDPGAPWAVGRDQPVFSRSIVIEGRAAQVPRVGDATWSFYPVVAQSNLDPSSYLIQWQTIPDDQREFIREHAFLALNVDPSGELGDVATAQLETLAGISTIQYARDLGNLLDEISTDGLRISEVTQDWFSRWLLSKKLSRHRKMFLIGVARRIYIYRRHSSFHAFDFMPWGRKSANSVAGTKSRSSENATPRIPEASMAPVMRWAHFYVEHAIPELVAHLRAHEQDLREGRLVVGSEAEAEVRLSAYLAKLRASGRGLPVKPDGSLSLRNVFHAAGVRCANPSKRPSLLAPIEEAFRNLGADTFDGSALPGTEVPWTKGLTGRRATFAELFHGLSACYLVSAAYSGARDSEVTDWRRQCLKLTLAADSSVLRYKVHGRILRCRGSMGEVHAWVVIELVAKALEAAEVIQDYVGESRTCRGRSERGGYAGNYLFASPLLHEAARPPDLLGPGVGNGSFAKKIRAFVRHCRVLALSAAERADRGAKEELLAAYGIPGVNGTRDGEPWRWNTRQLRRTLAWHIGNQPFGIIAGKIQYGHASALMFEGYAGSSQSGFRAEVEQERELKRMRDVVEDYENWREGRAPAGPMGARLSKRFEAIREELGDLPGAVVDEGRRNKMLKNVAVNVYPGFINDCHFHAEHALCLARKPKKDGGPEADGPFWASCDAEQCPNSSITPRHLPALRSCKADAEAMLARPGQSPLQRITLKNSVARYDGMIAKVAV